MMNNTKIKCLNDSKREQSRIEYIDVAKGICILYIVFWHCVQFCIENYSHVFYIILSFVLPLFFVLSGMFISNLDKGFFSFVRKPLNRLLIPFLAFFLITSVLLPLGSLIKKNVTDPMQYLEVFGGWYLEKFPNLALWFLLCLFNCNLIFFAIYSISNKAKNNTIAILLFFSIVVGVIGVLLGINRINIPIFYDSAMTCIPYFCFGFFLRKYTNILSPNKYDKYNLFYCVILGFILFLITNDFGVVGYMSNTIHENAFVIYASGLGGSLLILLLCKIVGNLPLLSYLGRYSIMILLVHYFMIPYIKKYIGYLLDNSVVLCLSTFIVTMVICLSLIPFFCKYLPNITAQKNLI